MGLRTWQVTLPNKRVINVKGAKVDVEKLAREFRKFNDIHEYTRELCGTLGGHEYEMTTWTIGICHSVEHAPPPNQAEYALDKLVYFNELPDTILDVAAEMAKVNALFVKHVRVNDKRTTTDTQAAVNENMRVQNERRMELGLQQTHAWLDARGLSHDKVTIPDGMMAITAQTTYDGSDMMSDYFHPHAPIGERLLLALVPKQAETERLARAAVARYPELSDRTFEWHTEKYSMGHGNYLTSEYYGTDTDSYKGEVKIRLEIEFGNYPKELYQFKGYPGVGTVQSTDTGCKTNAKAEMTLNPEKDGVEIKFIEKPDQDVISNVKAHGFKWSKRQQLWYAKQSPQRVAFAEQITQ